MKIKCLCMFLSYDFVKLPIEAEFWYLSRRPSNVVCLHKLHCYHCTEHIDIPLQVIEPEGKR